jgi:tRNA pseudouridine38-40 synthase
MPRYKLDIEYDGGPFSGWQMQKNRASVQGEIAAAIQRFCGEQAIPVGAGRTDAGVHASGQVAHIDLLGKPWEAYKVCDALNQHLRPLPISITGCEQVSEEFHARFSATRRRYLYRIVCRRAPLAIKKNRAWQVFRPLDIATMHDAAQILVGRHDFTTFRSVHCQAASPVKTIDRITVYEHGEEIFFKFFARSFLHTQVRSMVGSLKYIGEGKITGNELKEALKARDRVRCAPLAPPYGLYLTGVDYGEQS